MFCADWSTGQPPARGCAAVSIGSMAGRSSDEEPPPGEARRSRFDGGSRPAPKRSSADDAMTRTPLLLPVADAPVPTGVVVVVEVFVVLLLLALLVRDPPVDAAPTPVGGAAFDRLSPRGGDDDRARLVPVITPTAAPIVSSCCDVLPPAFSFAVDLMTFVLLVSITDGEGADVAVDDDGGERDFTTDDDDDEDSLLPEGGGGGGPLLLILATFVLFTMSSLPPPPGTIGPGPAGDDGMTLVGGGAWSDRTLVGAGGASLRLLLLLPLPRCDEERSWEAAAAATYAAW
uniref:Uncharacterized protein n=1 Tax=Anopheles atroparvus TaxID=41427 RepID=A0A182JGZ9_ANOAO